ncbi:MAG: EF-P lysine aminoacylase GenX [Deltaproteobacteria bacterium]|nr:EF-P lysine aminoacylase GenX [Deltaproteobacteria bacterium]
MAPARDETLRGRITWVGGGRVRLESDAGPLRVTWADAHEEMVGRWAEMDATETTTGWVARRVTLGAAPLASFPKPSGDWLAFHGQERAAITRLRARAQASRTLRDLLELEGFLEVETPLAVPSPGLDLHLAAFEVQGMRAPRFLITSPEYQMKRLLAAGLPRIYALTRCFRKDERGHRHEPEFTMLEWYRAFENADALMRDTERIVETLASALTGGTRLAIDALGARSVGTELAGPWDRLSVADAIARFTSHTLAELLAEEERFFLVWSHEVEPKLGFDRPVFVIDWPASMASLARLHPDRPAYADRFEAYVCGIEICNGFGELIDPIEQRARLLRDQEARRAAGLPVYPIDERFLGALEEGLPPCAGNAMGFDRVVALLTGAPTVADVMAFGSDRL